MTTLVDLNFYLSDAPASVPGAALPISGAPDTIDFSGMQFPMPVEIIGIMAASTITSTDTITLTPLVAGVVPAGAPTAVLSGTGVAEQSVFFGTGQGLKVAANAIIGLQYKTTTGGTYTVHDIGAKLLVKLPDVL